MDLRESHRRLTQNITSENLTMFVRVNAYFTVVITLSAVTANFLNIFIFLFFRKVRNLSNKAITFLSITDLLRSIIIMPLKSYNQLTFATTLNTPVCELTAFTSAFTFGYNPMLLAAIAVLRYLKIFPWTKRSELFTKTVFYKTCFGLLLIAVIFAFLPFLGIGKYAYSKYHGVCFTDWSRKNLTFRSIFYSIVVGLSFPVLMVFYVKLYRVLRQHKKVILSNYDIEEKTKSRTRSALSIPFSVDKSETPKRRSTIAVIYKTEFELKKAKLTSTVTSFSQKRYHKRKMSEQKLSILKHLTKQEIQVTKLLLCIFVAYCICWLPAAVVNFMAFAFPGSVPEEWYYVIVTLVELKAALNPLIYTVGNRNYRYALKKTC